MRAPLDRRTLAAASMLAPAMAMALLVAALEAGRARQPDDPLFAAPAARSLDQAILGGDVEAAWALVRAGHDPNQLLEIHLPGTPPDRVSTLSPLMLAVAARQANSVRMLLGAGVDLQRQENGPALCLARELGDKETTTVLALAMSGQPSCPQRALD